ncbi:MAG: helix-turn-helix domain-containing protein [Spirochaetaceae bacterium]|nr:helix-turn-helix domain-containing protein [Spirochaetaceae bacterium]
MESFGEILRTTRESKGIDIPKAERETSISKEYIIALETENVSAFPGEPYLIGFLRNYSEYLGLDSKKLISLYKAKMIQESPIPEGLLKSDPPRFLKPLIISLASAVVLAAIVLVCVFAFKKEPESENAILTEAKKGAEYQLTAMPIQKRIYKDDILKVIINNETVELTVSGTKNFLTLNTPVGLQIIELGEEIELNVDGKDKNDIVVFLSDISKNDEQKGAEVRMFTLDPSQVAKVEPTVNVGEIPLASEIEQKKSSNQIVLFEGNRAYPFTIDATFRGACLFRYAPDRKDSVEDYFTTGDRFVTTVNNTIRVWMSNANALKLQVIGDGRTESIEVGRPGQVLVQDIKWIKDYDGKYKLVVLEVD